MSAVSSLPAPGVRPMRSADLGAVYGVETGSYRFPWSIGIFRDCLRAGYSCWVIGRAGAVEGYAIMQIAAGECHVLNLCIGVASQRQGLGRVLLAHLLEVARERGALTCLLEVRPTNLAARALYAEAGFREVGVRRAYYPGENGREDALILAFDL